MKKRNQQLISKLVVSLITAAMLTMSAASIMAESTTEMTRAIKNYKEASIDELEWDDPDKAPTIKVTIKDAYKLKGKAEEFEINLTGAEWYEKKDTTLSFSNTEGIAIYDGYISTDTDTKARVHIDIPNDFAEDKDIVLEIPLLIKVQDKKEEVSAKISDTDSEDGLVSDAYIPLAISTDKQMNWSVGAIPEIEDGGSIAPITFTETQAGILGSRELEVYLLINNRYLRFKEPEYASKTENSDDIDYYLDVDRYLEYKGGFKNEGQQLKVTISKDGQSMRVRMSGSVPTEVGSMMLKNLAVESTTNDELDEDVIITVQSEKILNNNAKVTAAHYKTQKAAEKEEAAEKTDDTEKAEETPVEEVTQPAAQADQTTIKFKVGEEQYILNDMAYKMQGKTYIKSPGYTMVPVRYVAEALGVNDMQFLNNTVSFSYNGQSVILTMGSRQATVAQQPQLLEVPLEAVDGRTYAPIGSIAKLLNIEKSWDNAAQTACFVK